MTKIFIAVGEGHDDLLRLWHTRLALERVPARAGLLLQQIPSFAFAKRKVFDTPPCWFRWYVLSEVNSTFELYHALIFRCDISEAGRRNIPPTYCNKNPTLLKKLMVIYYSLMMMISQFNGISTPKGSYVAQNRCEMSCHIRYKPRFRRYGAITVYMTWFGDTFGDIACV